MFFPVDLPGKYQSLAEKLNINPDDIGEYFTRGGGPGGQKINVTSNCVELTHLPTGLTVRVQCYRERSANRLAAYKRLILKIDERVRGKESEKAKKIFKLRKQKQKRSKRAQQKLVEEKRRKGEVKRLRGEVKGDI